MLRAVAGMRQDTKPIPGRCVQCRQPLDLSPANPWRPFCSERCKLLDLGAWFEGRRAIPADDSLPDDTPAQDQ
ncbi:MAG TPA: DNA gyrase inhibitor YacG [Solimonas sp.]|nr:DNA gyrase inhibitor YacG [Solimonas sp.]